MKILISVLALSITSASFAGTITGTVKKFSGRYVESGRPYAYSALATGKGKLILPEIINADLLAAVKDNKVTIEADIVRLMCTDMSSACPSGKITNVKSVKIEIAEVKEAETFDGPVKRFKGRAVETPRLYNYIAVDASDRIEIPDFLNAEALLKAKAEMTVTGKAKHMMCTDMSAACGPTKVSPLESVEIRL